MIRLVRALAGWVLIRILRVIHSLTGLCILLWVLNKNHVSVSNSTSNTTLLKKLDGNND